MVLNLLSHFNPFVIDLNSTFHHHPLIIIEIRHTWTLAGAKAPARAGRRNNATAENFMLESEEKSGDSVDLKNYRPQTGDFANLL